MLPNQLYKHKYPQNIWAENAVKIIHSLPLSENSLIVDAPCGNGIIAWFVKKAFSSREVWAFDLDEQLLNSPYLRDNGIVSRKSDIFNTEIRGNDNVWLLINSLYCLPEKEKLIDTNRTYYKYIICVIPDIEKSNFKFFTKKNPDFQNPSIMKVNETIELFKSHNYRLLDNKGITRLPFHKLNQWIIFLKLPLNVKNFIFFALERFYFFGVNQYRILTFERV